MALDCFMLRSKKYCIFEQDENLRAPLADLKRAIDEVMEEQSKRYDEECAAQQLAKYVRFRVLGFKRIGLSKSLTMITLPRLDDRAPLAASTDEDDDGVSATPGGEEKTKRTYAPRRKFQWNDKIKSVTWLS